MPITSVISGDLPTSESHREPELHVAATRAERAADRGEHVVHLLERVVDVLEGVEGERFGRGGDLRVAPRHQDGDARIGVPQRAKEIRPAPLAEREAGDDEVCSVGGEALGAVTRRVEHLDLVTALDQARAHRGEQPRVSAHGQDLVRSRHA
jgi:hypothetical protein